MDDAGPYHLVLSWYRGEQVGPIRGRTLGRWLAFRDLAEIRRALPWPHAPSPAP